MKYYTSRSGDTLLRVAVLFYFRHDLYEYLYQHNRPAIGEDIFMLGVNTKLAIPEPLTEEIPHAAAAGETSRDLSERYYGVQELYARIDEANDWPAKLVPGEIYRVPALLSPIEFAAAAEARKKLSVEFDR